MAVSLSNALRAKLTPQQMLFTPDNWSMPQLVRVTPEAAAAAAAAANAMHCAGV